jgi:hypothetical protein
MSRAVVLLQDGTHFVGEYDGYGSVGGFDDEDGDGLAGEVCLHEACWEKAGKPACCRYESGSTSAADQGWFFDDGDHDLIDPRITEGREELLRKGVEARTKRRYDQKASQVRGWIQDEMFDDTPRWRQRFNFMQQYDGRTPLENQWTLTDRFEQLFQEDSDRNFTGTEAEATALCAKAWETFVASDECKALLARAEEMRLDDLRRYAADLRSKGRYEVGYGASKKGDTVDGRKLSRSLYYVSDKITFERVAVFDFEGAPQTFEAQRGYSGNHSPAWEARVEENRADDRARRAKAEAEAARLEAEWAAAGKPITFYGMVL